MVKMRSEAASVIHVAPASNFGAPIRGSASARSTRRSRDRTVRSRNRPFFVDETEQLFYSAATHIISRAEMLHKLESVPYHQAEQHFARRSRHAHVQHIESGSSLKHI